MNGVLLRGTPIEQLIKLKRLKDSGSSDVTLTGDIVSFNASAVKRIKLLSVAIEPQQSGSGDPSPVNIRPITGWTGAKAFIKPEYDASATPTISVTFPALGKNLLNPNGTKILNKYISSTGEYVADNQSYIYDDPIPVLPNTQYCISGWGEGAVGYIRVAEYTSNDSFIQRTISDNSQLPLVVITTTSTTKYLRISPNYAIGKIMVEKDASIRAYEDYTNTLYGGTLDLVSGVLTVDRIKHSPTSCYTFSSTNTYGNIRATGNALKKNATNNISDTLKFVMVGGSGLSDNQFSVSGGAAEYYFVKVAECTTKSELDSWLSTNKPEFVLALAEPFTIQLTPQQINTLIGENHVWSDAGDVTLIAKGITPIE